MNNILNISEAASIAIHTMYLLANNRNRLYSTKEIASILDVSENHLSKVLQRLVKENMVDSIRGPKGGFKLNYNYNKITLLDIYETIDGPILSTNCLLKKPICQGNCVLGELISSLNQKLKHYFENKKISDFIKD